MNELMSAAELERHHASDHGRISYGDGYDDMEINERQGWHTIANWGRDGWEMGEWPYVMISARRKGSGAEVLSVCEGDHTIYQFDTYADHIRALNYLFCWYQPEIASVNRDELDAGTAIVDPKFLGAYSHDRINA